MENKINKLDVKGNQEGTVKGYNPGHWVITVTMFW